jgi:glycosyltransferase involved in cell wall biosynthesis
LTEQGRPDNVRSTRAPRVTVIVPVYNGAAFITGCLAALDAQTIPPEDYEVIVVDDASTDETPDLVRRFIATARARVHLIVRPHNGGQAAGRNDALKEAAGELVAFTDSDCEPAPDWLERALHRFAVEPALAGIEGRTVPKGSVGTLTHQMTNVTGGHWMTCNVFYRREAIARTGGFDERFRTFLEDSDVAFAVQENGGSIAWDPDVLVEHVVLYEGRGKFMREARKRFYNPLLYRKHPELYKRHIRTVVPGIPRLHLKYMGSIAWIVIAAVVYRPLAVPGVPFLALYLRRVLHAYRARDLVSALQVSVHPFVQTFWVLAGAVRFRTFSPYI